MIYLDNSATTWPKPESVYLEADRLTREYAFNAGRGSHTCGRKAQSIVNSSRKALSKVAGCDSDKVVFTPSATMALNEIIFGIGLKPGDTVYISPFEHNSVVRPLHSLGYLNLEIIPFDSETWDLDETKLESMFRRNKPKAVLLSEVSNVTGYRLPWEKIFRLSNKFGSINILDASQSFDKKAYDDPNLDILVFNGHKSLYGIFGAAGFMNITGKELTPYIYGGTGSDSLNLEMPLGTPQKLEAGSLNLTAIGVLPEAINWLKKVDSSLKEDLASSLIEGLSCISGIEIYFPKRAVNEGIVSFNLEGYDSEELASILDQDFGICVRGGYHCAPLVHDFIGSDRFKGTVRASLSYFNKEQDINSLISAIKELSEELL